MLLSHSRCAKFSATDAIGIGIPTALCPSGPPFAVPSGQAVERIVDDLGSRQGAYNHIGSALNGLLSRKSPGTRVCCASMVRCLVTLDR